jgi:hypothetical protein
MAATPSLPLSPSGTDDASQWTLLQRVPSGTVTAATMSQAEGAVEPQAAAAGAPAARTAPPQPQPQPLSLLEGLPPPVANIAFILLCVYWACCWACSASANGMRALRCPSARPAPPAERLRRLAASASHATLRALVPARNNATRILCSLLLLAALAGAGVLSYRHLGALAPRLSTAVAARLAAAPSLLPFLRLSTAPPLLEVRVGDAGWRLGRGRSLRAALREERAADAELTVSAVLQQLPLQSWRTTPGACFLVDCPTDNQAGVGRGFARHAQAVQLISWAPAARALLNSTAAPVMQSSSPLGGRCAGRGAHARAVPARRPHGACRDAEGGARAHARARAHLAESARPFASDSAPLLVPPCCSAGLVRGQTLTRLFARVCRMARWRREALPSPSATR